MYDQANELRHLVSQQATPPCAHPTDGARLLVVAGGKGGVGTTTLAVNLAAALAHAGRAVGLVDADLSGGNLALFCRLQERSTLADVLAGRRTVHEALEVGPAGTRVLAGSWELGPLAESPPAAQQRLIAQLKGLRPALDQIVVDVGNGWNRWASRWWQAADRVLMITTPDLASIMDAYAAIKVLAAEETVCQVDLVVNRADGPRQVEGVQARLAGVCQRFLARELGAAGFVTDDPQVPAAATAREPFVLAAPDCPAARQLRQLAAALASKEGDATRTARKVQPEVAQTPIARNSLGIETVVKLY